MARGTTTLHTGPEVAFRVNGQPTRVTRSPERSLLELLRFELNLVGTKYGCGEGECGACTVLIDGNPMRSCQVHTSELDGVHVVTVEGLATGGSLNPVQRAFVELGAFQCGFCTPGMVVRATALLRRNPHPSESEVREELQGNVCRCCGYARILSAVLRASEFGARTPPGDG